MQRFIILAAQRTGSNMLCTLLHSHPDVLCHHEIFNPDKIITALPLRDTEFSLGSMEERKADPIEFMDRVWKNNLNHSWVGFKMTHRQHPLILDAVCKDPSIHKIVLKRKGRLKTYVSQLIAERSDVWEDYQNTTEVIPPRPVYVDYKKLHLAIEHNEQFHTDLNKTIKGPQTNLTYETLLEKNTQQQLLSNLGLSHCHLTAKSRQQNPHPLRKLISNKYELAQKLSHLSMDKELLLELELDIT